ncbi:Ankyrin repeat domain-containing protein [Plasmodiophora brassicae]|uniref:Uncharacterized protein n=1 Tax=Plasmodiophora brassicae TaxID=37360 RepID=A0A0G4ITP5_PLABS|nr:hypothetical protein PBRA_006620 [Plasmodiophora brassicae]
MLPRLQLLFVLLWTIGLCTCDDVKESLTGALIRATYNGNLQAVADLLKRGAPANGKDNAAVILACTAGHKGIVALLVEHGADIRVHDDECLVRAAGAPSLDLVKYLVETLRVPVSAQCDDPLIAATAGSRSHIVEYLLDNRANPDARNGLPLRIASRFKLAPVSTLLLKAGATLNEHILAEAVETNDIPLVRLALQHGVFGGALDGSLMVEAYHLNHDIVLNMLVENVAPTDAWGLPGFLENVGHPDPVVLVRILKHDKVSRGGVIRAMEWAVLLQNLELLRVVLDNINDNFRCDIARDIALLNVDNVLDGGTNDDVSAVLRHHLLLPVVKTACTSTGDLTDVITAVAAFESRRASAEHVLATAQKAASLQQVDRNIDSQSSKNQQYERNAIVLIRFHLSNEAKLYMRIHPLTHPHLLTISIPYHRLY